MFSLARVKRTTTGWRAVPLAVLLSVTTASAQQPVFNVSSNPTPVISTGGAEVLGALELAAAPTCGTSSDGVCVSTAGGIFILFPNVPIENTVATGITVSETIGGVTITAPASGTLLSGKVTVNNTPAGGLLTLAVKGGVDLAAGDRIEVNGVRGEIVLSPAAAPGSNISAELSASATDIALFSATEVTVGTSFTGLEFVSASSPVPSFLHPKIVLAEGFGGAFVQYFASPSAGLPVSPRPSYGATNNTEVHLVAKGFSGQIQWPMIAPSGLAGGGGVALGGSELDLISQAFDGSDATYEFATHNQALSDSVTETFTFTLTVCGSGTASVQAQLAPSLGNRPGFNDPLIPSPAATFTAAVACMPGPVSAISGENQFGVVGKPLPQPLMIKFENALGNPVSGLTVDFTALKGGGSITPATATTDVTGTAQAVATLGPKPGVNSFIASVGNISVIFYETAVPPQVPPFPNTQVVPQVVTGGGFLTRIMILNQSPNSNPTQVNFLSQAGDVLETNSQTIPANGRVDVSTSSVGRFSGQTSEWAIVGSQYPVEVNFTIELEAGPNNPPSTAVSFAAPRLLSNVTFPVSLVTAPGGKTDIIAEGVAFANASLNSTTLTLTLVDSSGVARSTDTITIGPFSQTTSVLADRPAFAGILSNGGEFDGVLVASASQPVSEIELGSDFAQYFANPGYPAASCAPSPFEAAPVSFLPHLPVGAGWATRLVITNPCAVADNLEIEVFDSSGSPASSWLPPSLTLEPSQTVVLSSPAIQRFGPLANQWTRIASQLPIGLQVLLDFQPAANQPPSQAVGYSSAGPGTKFELPVDFAPAVTSDAAPRDFGLALANTSSSQESVTMNLIDQLGNVVAEDTSISLAPNGQTAILVSSLPGFQSAFAASRTFSGKLLITTTQPTSILGVAFDFGPAYSVPLLTP